jgi:hypothetical protein
MKKIYLSLVSIVGALGLHAQTINSLHFPSPGDNFTYFLTDTNGIYPGTSGANQVWNFEDLNVDFLKTLPPISHLWEILTAAT